MAHPKWRDTAELIGIASIVASLIFVGLQLKQAQDFAIAGQYLDQASLVVEATNGRMQNEPLMRDYGQRLLATGEFLEEESIDPLVLAAKLTAAKNSLTILDNDHFQYLSGFQSDEAWQANRQILKDTLSSRYGRFAYEQSKENERLSFSALCEEIINEINSEAAINIP
jgi:hypothetical protein